MPFQMVGPRAHCREVRNALPVALGDEMINLAQTFVTGEARSQLNDKQNAKRS
jgi:hypothetical protein